METLVVLLGVVCTLGMLAGNLSMRQRRRRLIATPTSQAATVAAGPVEVSGTAESEIPLRSRLAECPCVAYRYEIEERYSYRREERFRDAQGTMRMSMRERDGWRSIEEGGERQDFLVRDETGSILVRAGKADLRLAQIFQREIGQGDPLYFGKGPAEAVEDSAYMRRFTEWAIPLHATVFVSGGAQPSRQGSGFELVDGVANRGLIVTTASEQSLRRETAGVEALLWLGGLGASTVIGFGVAMGSPMDGLGGPIGKSLAAYTGLSVFLWLIGSFDGLRELREGADEVRSAWADELEQRRRLLQRALELVATGGGGEAAVQAMLRPQLASPAPEYAALAPRLRELATASPALAAQPAYRKFLDELSRAELRLGAVGQRYAAIAQRLEARWQLFPEQSLVRLGVLRPLPPLAGGAGSGHR